MAEGIAAAVFTQGILDIGAKMFKDRPPKTSKEIAKCFISHATVDKSFSFSTFKLKIDENDSFELSCLF